MPKNMNILQIGTHKLRAIMQVAGSISWVHTALETGMTEVNVCYNLHKRRACPCATHTKKTKKPNRKWIWMSPGCRDRNMIDYILVQKNWVNGLTKYNNGGGLVESKGLTTANRLKSAATMMEYAELCKMVKKSTRSNKRVWIQ